MKKLILMKSILVYLVFILSKIIRRRYFMAKVLGRRRNAILFVASITTILAALAGSRLLAAVASKALLPPPPPDHDLSHFRRSRDLRYYLDNIQVLIEPSSLCESLEEIPLIVLVTSSPSRIVNREAIRDTWAKHQPTLFFLGLDGHSVDEQLVDIYIEAKQHSDIVVFDFHDHYQNLTLKTALMIQWSIDRCPQAEFIFKTDSDILLNPWTMKKVLEDNVDAKLVGYKKINSFVHRDEYNKWYMPRWLHREDAIPAFLSGTGYLINGEYAKKIIEAATKVPLINLEDVYITYLVAKKTLRYSLTHDRRLSPYKPWMPTGCGYWSLASSHSLRPKEMLHAWSKVLDISKEYERNKHVCEFYSKYFLSEKFLY